MTILKKNNLQDIIKNIKKKKKFSGGSNHEKELMEADDIDDYNKNIKKKILDNIFDEFKKIIDPLIEYSEDTFDINSFDKLKKIEGDYIKFNNILKNISEIKSKNLKAIGIKNPFEGFIKLEQNLNLITIEKIRNNFFKTTVYKSIKKNFYDIFKEGEKYIKVFQQIAVIRNKYDTISTNENKEGTDVEKLYIDIYSLINHLLVIIYIEKNNQNEYFILKNKIEKNINIIKEYYKISTDITYNPISVPYSANVIGGLLINSIEQIKEYNIYYKKREEIIKDKINNCEDPGFKNEIDMSGIPSLDSYFTDGTGTKDDPYLYSSKNLTQNFESDTSNFKNIKENMKNCALFSLALYNKFKDNEDFYSNEYYINNNKDNIIPEWKLEIGSTNDNTNDNPKNIGRIISENINKSIRVIGNITNKFIVKENIFAANDRDIEKYITSYLNFSKILKSLSNTSVYNNNKLKNIIKGYEIIYIKINEIYNHFENKENIKDFEKNINLAEYHYYEKKINPTSTSGGYLYNNEQQYIEQKYENINEKILRENAITVIHEINNYIPIFTGGGSEETKKFILEKISLLVSKIHKLKDDIKMLKDNSELYTKLEEEEKKDYYNLTKFSSLIGKVDNVKNKELIKKITIFDINYKEIETLAKIIERNIIGFYQSTKITDDIANAKKDKGADGTEGTEGTEGAEGAADGTEGAEGAAKSADDKNKSNGDGIRQNPIKFELIIRIFNMVITFIILVIFLIYISIFCISLLNMLIYIILVINDILINIFNDDITIYESLGYKILKYIDVQLTNPNIPVDTYYENYNVIKELLENDIGFYNFLIKNTDKSANDNNNNIIKKFVELNNKSITDKVAINKTDTDYTNLTNLINTQKINYNNSKFDTSENPVSTVPQNMTADKGSLNKEPYFYALFQQNIIYIMTDFLTLILFTIIILILLYFGFLLKAFIDSNILDGDINNPKTVRLSIMFFVFLLFITINIVLYKYLFSDIIFEKLVDIKKEHNLIDSTIFKVLHDSDPHIDNDYCEELRNNINDMDNINRFFMDDTNKYLTTTQKGKIVQKAFLYCLYSYLYEIVPTSNKSAISLIHNFIIAGNEDKIRDGGYLSFASFLSNSSSTNAIKKYYYNLGIFSDDNYLNNGIKADRDKIQLILKKKIEQLNLRLLTIPEQKMPLILLGLYFLINLILNFIGLILISYLIAKDKVLADDLKLFPEDLSEFLSKILLQLPYGSNLFKILTPPV